MSQKRRSWNPSQWSGLAPNGLGQIKPNHYFDMVKTVWENRDELPFAWRILRDGVCDGCALGTSGFRDHTMEGVHLCTTRLKLLRLNTMPALDVSVLRDAEKLSKKKGAKLRKMGRLPYPMHRKAGEEGFRRVTWDEALDIAGGRIRRSPPNKIAFYLTSKGITNEVYYVAQKVARFLGTNNVDYSARICHASSTIALKEGLGVAASTCSYQDWIGTDLLVLVGSNAPNSQPVTTKYIYLAKQQGTKVAVINPHREPGLERYWVPSVLESALFGTKLADTFFPIHTGGDVAFLNGVLKHLIERDAVNLDFIQTRTEGFEELQKAIKRQSWHMLERQAGISKEEMSRFADMIASARTAVFVWSMGVTQHVFGVQNVQAIINLALSQGFVGRENCGLMPIRGHSGVQGGAEVGCIPMSFPGGEAVGPESAARLSRLWGFEVPSEKGMNAVEMIDAARMGSLEVLYSVGGNFLETLPEPDYVEEALARIPLRIHQDIVLSPQMFVKPKEEVLLLPAQTRYEQRGGGTETTTERRILFSPEIVGRRIGEAKPEWEIMMEVAERAYPERRELIHFEDADEIRRVIAEDVPLYQGIQYLKGKGDAIQWGGPRLLEAGSFTRPNKQLRFTSVEPPGIDIPEGWFLLSTRRGKQFNSMVQGRYDPLTGGMRDDVFINREDAKEMGLREGAPVIVRSDRGEMPGKIRFMAIRPRNLQVYWPEGNVLIRRGFVEPRSGVPDYNALVQLIPIEESGEGTLLTIAEEGMA